MPQRLLELKTVNFKYNSDQLSLTLGYLGNFWINRKKRNCWLLLNIHDELISSIFIVKVIVSYLLNTIQSEIKFAEIFSKTNKSVREIL